MKNLILTLALVLGLAEGSYSQTPINIKKEKTGLTSFSYFIEYDLDQVNATRKESGVGVLKRSSYLDSCALVRCKRLVKFIKENPDKYVTDISVYHKEGHNDMFLWGSENTAQNIYGAGVPEDRINGLNENDILPLITKGKFGLFLAGDNYNKSEGHKEQRVKGEWKEYGSYYLAVFVYAKNYNPEGMSEYIPTRIIIHYEMFR